MSQDRPVGGCAVPPSRLTTRPTREPPPRAGCLVIETPVLERHDVGHVGTPGLRGEEDLRAGGVDASLQGGGSVRATFLAAGRAGWAALCRMVSSVHLSGERGRPVATLELIAPHLAGGDLLVMLGPSSELGAVASRRRDDLGPRAIEPWLEVVPRPNLVVELVSHRLGGRGGSWGPGSSAHAARMAGLARSAGITTVLMYFFGKVEGRLHGTDFKSEMGRLIHSPEFARALPAEMARCGQEAQERGRALQDLGEYLKGLVPPGN